MSMHINLKIGRDEYRAIPTEHIAYIEGHRRECTVHQWPGCGKPPLRISMCLSAIEPQLHQYHFVRCHRNFIVHPAALQWFGDKEIALPQGKPIPVSDMRVRRLPNGAPPARVIPLRLHTLRHLPCGHAGRAALCEQHSAAAAVGHAARVGAAQSLGGGRIIMQWTATK